MCTFSRNIFIDREAREIMYLVASVRLSVRPSVCVRSHGWKSNKSHYQSIKGVCLCVCDYLAYADNRADAVDRLLIDIVVDWCVMWYVRVIAGVSGCISIIQQFSVFTSLRSSSIFLPDMKGNFFPLYFLTLRHKRWLLWHKMMVFFYCGRHQECRAFYFYTCLSQGSAIMLELRTRKHSLATLYVICMSPDQNF